MQINDVKLPVAKRGHVLLVSPLTFSYHISISETLRSMGYDVTWWDERASSSTWYKLALRFFPTWTTHCSESIFLEKLSELASTPISHVLIVKGEGLSQKVALKVRETFSSASMGLYLWDGSENVKGIKNILPAFDTVSTFDPKDAEIFGWHYRPLFWRKINIKKNISQSTLFDWCFIGTIHSDRHRVIHRLRKQGGSKVKSFVFAYFQSPLILFIRYFLDWTLWFAPKGTLSTKSMPALDVAEKMESSKAMLDVEHPRQRGFTMRTIETLLAGKKLVTTNKHILGTNLYHPSRVHIIDRENPSIPSQFLEQPYVEISELVKEYYSCEGWVSELLKFQDARKNSKALLLK